jgi:hypothetical protein
VDDVTLTDVELKDQLRAATENYQHAAQKLASCEAEFSEVYPQACEEYRDLAGVALEQLLSLVAWNFERVRFMVLPSQAPELAPELLNSSVLPPDKLVENLTELVEVIDGLTAEILDCNQRALRGNDEKCRKLAKQREQLINGIGYSWLNNRRNMRFMVWDDPDFDAPAAPVVTASNTPEPPHEPTANKAEVFRFQLPYLSNIWRDVPTLARWVSEELVRNDEPGLVLVSGSNGNGFVTIEAFYNVNLIQSAGVYIAADNKGSN